MVYQNLGEMPAETAEAFEYLVATYGRKSLNPVSDQHEAAVAGIVGEMERAHATG